MATLFKEVSHNLDTLIQKIEFLSAKNSINLKTLNRTKSKKQKNISRTNLFS
jgi:hypothetical protein